MVEQPKLNIVTASTAELPDPFDLANLRLSQDFTETAGVKKLLLTVPVRKPHPQEFVRTHPSENYRMTMSTIELKEEREQYVVAANLVGELADEIVPKTLLTAVNRQGVVFLWPVRFATADGRQMEWHSSMREAAELATKHWIRVKANMGLGAYETFVAESITTEPTWPDLTFQELIRIAFRDGRLVDSADHPLIKRLRGLA
jgi:hypothetical protein